MELETMKMTSQGFVPALDFEDKNLLSNGMAHITGFCTVFSSKKEDFCLSVSSLLYKLRKNQLDKTYDD
jgi:hypothetical protein